MTVLPRVGVGVDVHAFAPQGSERALWVAGLVWPGERGLGNDGEVVVAVVFREVLGTELRALLGHKTCEMHLHGQRGDLGAHFGTSRPEFAGASGVTLLAEAARLVREAGFDIGNIAVQVIGNRPKIGTRRAEAQAALSAAAGAPVTVSGTTTDGLGLTGRAEGIAAIATALLIGSR